MEGKATLKKGLVKLVGGILLGGMAMSGVLSACAGTTAETSPTPATPQSTPTPTPTPTATPAPPLPPAPPSPAATVPPATPQPPPQPTGLPNSDILAQGKLVYEETAGGIGCAYCHGLDGRGRGAAGEGATYIRGVPEANARAALAPGGVAAMSFIKLSEEDLTAVVAYLKYLGEQQASPPEGQKDG